MSLTQVVLMQTALPDDWRSAHQRIVEIADEIAATYPEQVRTVVGDLVRVGMMSGWQRRGRDDLKYRTYEELVLALGTVRQVPHADIGGGVDPMEPKQCFENAAKLAISSVGTDEPLTYVEGFAVTRFFPVNHAWVETADGRIIDPTWSSLDGHGETVTYIGVRFDTHFLLERLGALVDKDLLGVLASDWALDVPALRFGFEVDDTGLVVGGRLEEER